MTESERDEEKKARKEPTKKIAIENTLEEIFSFIIS